MVTDAAAKPMFKYSHTIGQSGSVGPGFRIPSALARGKGDLIYVISRSYDNLPEAKRVTMLTVGEDYIGQFSSGGTEDGQFLWANGLAIDKDEEVYMSDEALNRISIFSKEGEFLGKWGIEGSDDGEFNRPSGIAFDSENNLFVVDNVNNRIQKFTKDGRFLAKWGQTGSGDGEFNLPWGIEIDREDNIYVADWRNDRIQKFNHDGQFLMKIGTTGNGDGELYRPAGVAVDSDGDIYILDWGNDRVQVFRSDGSFITTIKGDATMSKWGKEKLDSNLLWWQERAEATKLDREKRFWGPVSIDVDDDNRIFILESCRARLQVYQKAS